MYWRVLDPNIGSVARQIIANIPAFPMHEVMVWKQTKDLWLWNKVLLRLSMLRTYNGPFTHDELAAVKELNKQLSKQLRRR